jgi:hypothetical protein
MVWSEHARSLSWLLTQPLFKMGHVPGEDVGATRMQDEAGSLPADRRWSDVSSDARDDRLQTRTYNASVDCEHRRAPEMRLQAGGRNDLALTSLTSAYCVKGLDNLLLIEG